MEWMEMTTVAAITVICSLAAGVLKATPLANKWLPSICGGIGALLGGIAYAWVPAFPASDPLSAIAVGIAAGLAATGGYEAVHQLKKKEESA